MWYVTHAQISEQHEIIRGHLVRQITTDCQRSNVEDWASLVDDDPENQELRTHINSSRVAIGVPVSSNLDLQTLCNPG